MPSRRPDSDFLLLRRTLIQVHNRNVGREFVNRQKTLTDGEKALRKASTILPSDTAQEMLLRMGLFYFGAGKIDQFTTIAELQEYTIKREVKTPQLVISYKPVRAKTGQYGYNRLHIPHYDGTRRPNIPNFKQGKFVGTHYLKDSSFLRVYAESEAECERVLNAHKKYVNPAYLTNHEVIGQHRRKNINEYHLYPLRADFYPQGKKDQYGKKLQPAWREYFKK